MRTAFFKSVLQEDIEDLQEEHVEDEIQPKWPKIQKCRDRSPVLADKGKDRDKVKVRNNIWVCTL